MDSAWSLFENGRFRDAYQLFDKEYIENKSHFSLRNRATAALLLKEYNLALRDYLVCFQETQESYRGDHDYINIGVAYWLLNDYDNAIMFWTDSMIHKLKYSANIGIPPCIVYFAATLRNDKNIMKASVQYLKRKWKSNIALAGFLLDKINEKELIGSINEESSLRLRHLCKYEFYIAVKHLQNGDRDGYIEHLKKCVEARGGYLEFEYFLAVGELDKELNRQ